MANRYELILLLSLFAGLVAFTLWGPQPATSAPEVPGSSFNSGETGALALQRWLDGQGYDAEALAYRDFSLAASDDVLFVLGPSDPVTLEHVRQLRTWVEAGGTLIIAQQQPTFSSGQLLDEFDIATERLDDNERVGQATPFQPLLSGPPLRAFQVDTEYVLRPESPEYLSLAGDEDRVVLVWRSLGSGHLFVSSSLRPFTNAGLRDEGSGELVLNLLRLVPPDARLLFDEYHHGFVGEPDQPGWLDTAWGQAGFYIALVLVGFLLLTARRFGAAVPLAEDVARRSSAEYVISMAGLFQRAGQRSYVLRHFHQDLKRRLARPFGISPRLNDDEFVDELVRYRTIDQAALRTLLTRLRQPDVSEAELVRLVAEADQLIRNT